MALFSNNYCPEPGHRLVNITLSTELHSPNGILWLARLQTKLNSKEAELSDINRTLGATIDVASTLQQMKDAIENLSQPERETVALCALLRSGAEASMDSRESNLRQLAILSEALEVYDIDLRAVALSQVVKGWPLRMDEKGQQNQDGVIRASNDFTTPHYEMFTDSSNIDKRSEIDVVAWGMRACYLMHKCFEDEAKGQLAPLTPEAEAGFRRGLLTLIPTLPEETLSGVPLFGKELLDDVNSETLFGKFRDIVQARACFHLLQIGLTNDLQKIAESGNGNAPTPLEKYLKGELDQSGMIRQYLRPVIKLRSDCRQEFIDSLEGELVTSVVNPLNYENSYALNKFRFEEDDTDYFLSLSVQRFASKLKRTNLQIERNNRNLAAGPENKKGLMQEALEQAGVDLAICQFFDQYMHDDGNNFFIDDFPDNVNEHWRKISNLLQTEIGIDSITKLITAERALFKIFSVRLGIYLAEIQLHNDGKTFDAEIKQEMINSLNLPRNSISSNETNSTPAPLDILKKKAATRTELLEQMAEKKPRPDVIISRAVSALKERFPLFTPTSHEESAELERNISYLHRVPLKENIKSWCTPLEDLINTKLGLEISQDHHRD